jgi:hypothetical protein
MTAGCEAGSRIIHIGCTGGGAVETLLDAVTSRLDLREGEIDLGDYTGDVEALGVWQEAG